MNSNYGFVPVDLSLGCQENLQLFCWRWRPCCRTSCQGTSRRCSPIENVDRM